MPSKACSKCGVEKDLSEFHRSGSGHKSRCIKCRAVYYQQNKHHYKSREKKYRERDPSRKYEYDISRNYGLTLEDVDRMMVEQKGRCPICGQDFVKVPSIDHDHNTGEVRGLLCRECNRGIGLLGDDLASLQRAVEYLRNA